MVRAKQTTDQHAALWVRDLARMTAFYEDAVGLERTYTGTAAGRPTAWYHGLQLFEAPPDVALGEGSLNHVGLTVENIAEVCGQLAAHGVAFERPLAEYPLPELGCTAWWVFFRDPEGNRVELVQVDLAGGAPRASAYRTGLGAAAPDPHVPRLVQALGDVAPAGAVPLRLEHLPLRVLVLPVVDEHDDRAAGLRPGDGLP